MVINIHKQRGKEESLTTHQLFHLILHVNASAALYTLLRSTGKVGGHMLTHRCCLSLMGMALKVFAVALVLPACNKLFISCRLQFNNQVIFHLRMRWFYNLYHYQVFVPQQPFANSLPLCWCMYWINSSAAKIVAFSISAVTHSILVLGIGIKCWKKSVNINDDRRLPAGVDVRGETVDKIANCMWQH